jgi:hypothetical protein
LSGPVVDRVEAQGKGETSGWRGKGEGEEGGPRNPGVGAFLLYTIQELSMRTREGDESKAARAREWDPCCGWVSRQREMWFTAQTVHVLVWQGTCIDEASDRGRETREGARHADPNATNLMVSRLFFSQPSQASLDVDPSHLFSATVTRGQRRRPDLFCHHETSTLPCLSSHGLAQG